MRGPVIAASVVALLVAPVATPRPASAAASQAPQGPIEQELIALDKKIEEAVRRREPSAIADLMTDDFRQVVPVGVRTKAEVLKTLATPPADAAPPPTPLEPTYSVHVYGDTAVMTHVTKQTDPHDPAPNGTRDSELREIDSAQSEERNWKSRTGQTQEQVTRWCVPKTR